MLTEGEQNRAHRIRAAAEVHEWLTGLSAAERGEILAQAYAAHRSALEASPDGQRARILEWAEQRRFGAVATEQPAPLSLEGATVLRVVSAQLAPRLRNQLRWQASKYLRLEELLAQGDVLRLERVNGKGIWRTVQGDAIRRDTVFKLFEVGNLELSETEYLDASPTVKMCVQ